MKIFNKVRIFDCISKKVKIMSVYKGSIKFLNGAKYSLRLHPLKTVFNAVMSAGTLGIASVAVPHSINQIVSNPTMGHILIHGSVLILSAGLLTVPKNKIQEIMSVPESEEVRDFKERKFKDNRYCQIMAPNGNIFHVKKKGFVKTL